MASGQDSVDPRMAGFGKLDKVWAKEAQNGSNGAQGPHREDSSA